MNNPNNNQAPTSGFTIPIVGTVDNGKPFSELEDCGDLFAVFGDNRSMDEQCEFNFDTPGGDDSVFISLTPESTSDAEAPVVTDGGDVEAGESCSGPLADVDIDAPLYGAEEDNIESWKSVDFHVDGGDTTDAAAGDSNVPPPGSSATPSETEEPESGASPDGERIDGGYLPAVLIERDSEGPDGADNPGAFSSIFDDGALGWIPPIYPEALWRDTLQKAGKPYETSVSKEGVERITAIRARYFARYVVLRANLHMHHGVWYAYSDAHGTWEQLDESKLLNIVDECITNFGDQMQLPGFGKLCSVSFCLGVIKMLVPFYGYENIFNHAPTYVINVRNGTLSIDPKGKVVFHEHSPNFLCRSFFDIDYDPAVDYREFVKLAFSTVKSKEDIPVMQMYSGQCLLGKNRSQTILQLNGVSGAGKSTFTKLIQLILGDDLWAELRPEQVKRPFEIASYDGMHALFAPDKTGDAMMTCGGAFMKGAVGDDPMTGELKFLNKRSKFNGTLNIITTSNAPLCVPLEDDHDAWRRRLRVVSYNGKPRQRIDDFAGFLFRQYKEHALKWMVDGIAALRRFGGIPVPPEMAQRIDAILQKSNPYLDFVKTRVERTGDSTHRLPSMDLFRAFKASGLAKSDADQTMKENLGKAMLDAYGAKKSKHLPGPKGNVVNLYAGFKLVLDD